MNKRVFNIRRMIFIALLTAVAYVLYLLEFPLFVNGYLKMDFSDLAALIGGILFGPFWAVVIEFLKNLLELLTKGIGTQMGFGNIMNFVVGTAFVLPFSILFRALERKDGVGVKTLTIASLVSTLSMIIVGFFGNLAVTPLFFKYFLKITLPKEAVLAAAGTATLFNLIKCAILITASVLYALYIHKRLSLIVYKMINR